MSKKGRPKSGNPKCKNYRLRLTQEEYDLLRSTSQKRKETMSKVLLDGLQIEANRVVFPIQVTVDIPI